MTENRHAIYEMADGIFIAGQLSTSELSDALTTTHAKSVLNVRSRAEASHESKPFVDQSETCALHGARYLESEVFPPSLSDAQIDAALSKIDAAERPILVHCKGGLRAAFVVAMHLATRLGLAPEDALERVKLAGQDSGSARLGAFLVSYVEGKIARVRDLAGVDVVRENELYVSSQPDEAALERAVREWGVRTVVNLRDPRGEAGDLGMGVLAREPEICERLGVAYVSVPTEAGSVLAQDKIDEINAAMDAAQKPILLHCRTRNRSEQVVAAGKND